MTSSAASVLALPSVPTGRGRGSPLVSASQTCAKPTKTTGTPVISSASISHARRSARFASAWASKYHTPMKTPMNHKPSAIRRHELRLVSSERAKATIQTMMARSSGVVCQRQRR